MALLLCIDAATESATVGLCDGTTVIASLRNEDQKNHSAFLQKSIQNMMHSAAVSFHRIDAVAVINGPGSYTGLRVGLASAKGICYAAGKSLILLNTLQVMALAAIERCKDADALYCPVIDARRNEVFTALYNFSLQPLLPPHPLIIDNNAFADQLAKQKVYFFGSGHNKCKQIIKHENAAFTDVSYQIGHMNELAQQLYVLNQFADVAYSEPFYTKDFYLPGK